VSTTAVVPPALRRIIAARALRGFADGFVSVLLARYLISLGFSPVQIGAIVTATLIGSAALTLAVGLSAHRYPTRTVLLGASALMVATGVGFISFTWFWPLIAVAAIGTLNPSAGDVSVFLPTEQAFVADHTGAADRPRLYAFYNLAGAFAGALGALASIAPEPVSRALGWDLASTQRVGFLVYVVTGLVIFTVYRDLQTDHAHAVGLPSSTARRRALGSSRRVVLQLAALFSVDSAASGFVVQSLLILWLHLRFDLSAAATGGVFFAAGLLGASSQLLASRLAARIGLVRTMVFTHLPANALLALAAFAPRAWIAITLLLVRALFAQMDVPARQAFVMSVVPAEERAAASGVTNVPRSLASAATPLLAGVLLDRSTFGWPLLIAGGMKIAYDLTLLVLFRDVGPALD